ncbi:hypothetical protein K8R33_03315 [archaeon]|nr:hypothetical protein [archaeon]
MNKSISYFSELLSYFAEEDAELLVLKRNKKCGRQYVDNLWVALSAVGKLSEFNRYGLAHLVNSGLDIPPPVVVGNAQCGVEMRVQEIEKRNGVNHYLRRWDTENLRDVLVGYREIFLAEGDATKVEDLTTARKLSL